MIVGNHLVIDYFVDNEDGILCDASRLENVFRRAFTSKNIKIINFCSHTFPGEGGVTGIFLLAESHASFHTWPEFRLLCFDIFACGNVDLDIILSNIDGDLKFETISKTLVTRGI